ncbi:MAG: tetratricopeptide repeat protein [Candidatus Omnitrophica bacterium]|nr:tetratricopeptide repeat protein [Candidatus Omnitrophota bacterium]
MRRSKERAASIAFGIVLFFLLLELGMRAGAALLAYSQEHRNIVSLRQKHTCRIVCLGESTTAGGMYSYPARLEEVLNNAGIGREFSVINKGVVGIDTSGILAGLDGVLDKYEPDIVIAMMGANDERPHLLFHVDSGSTIVDLLAGLKTVKLARMLWFNINSRIRPPRAIRSATENSTVYFDLGQFYRDRREYVKAEEMFRAAAQENTADYRPYFELGCLYKKRGDFSGAAGMFKRAIELEPDNDRAYRGILAIYNELSLYGDGKEYLALLLEMKKRHYRPSAIITLTPNNYRKLKEALEKRGILLVCAQYPMRSIEPLEEIFGSGEGVILVDNEKIFKDAVRSGGYDRYFTDTFGGDFGHCTAEGNLLLAKNIADVIMARVFDKNGRLAYRKTH